MPDGDPRTGGDDLTLTVETVRGVAGSTRTIIIPAELLKFSFSRSRGPGGQNVNKVNTRAEMRVVVSDLLFTIGAGGKVDDAAGFGRRLRQMAAKSINREDELIITSGRFRSQLQNRQACLESLTDLLTRSIPRPRVRRKTKPTRSSVRKRLDEKKHRGLLKSARKRKRPRSDNET